MVFYFGALLVSLAFTRFTDAATIYIEADVDNRIFTPSAVRADLGDVIDIQSRGALEWGFVEAVGYDTPCTESQQPQIRYLNSTSETGTTACPSRLTRARFVVRDASTHIVFALGRCKDEMVLAVNLLPDQSLDTLQINVRRGAEENASSTESCPSIVPNSFDVSFDTLPTPTPAESTTTFNLRLAFAISIPVLVAIAAGIWFYTDYRRKRRGKGRPYMRQQDTEQYSFPLPPLEEAPIYTRTDESAALSVVTRTETGAPLTSSSGASEYPPRPRDPGATSKWPGGPPGSNIDVEVPLKQDIVAQHNRPESRTTIDSLPSYRT